jgi:hypothetical protein
MSNPDSPEANEDSYLRSQDGPLSKTDAHNALSG